MLLAGDIGGTKTALGLFEPGGDPAKPLVKKVYPSRDYPDLESLVTEFSRLQPARLTAAAFGVAGPVTEGSVSVTNLPWTVDSRRLSSTLGIEKVWLINDLQAVAESIPGLGDSDVRTIYRGNWQPTGNRAVVAPGTGLGEAFLTWNQNRYTSHSTEGGHADFAPTDALQQELLAYLWQTMDHVSYENVCAGVGIPNIYRFLRDTGVHPEPAELKKELDTVDDVVPVIFRYALEKTRATAICVATLEMFISILGAECGNVALKIRPTGGLYLAGGLAPRIIDHLATDLFLKPFFNKGSMTGLVRSIPVRVIVNPDTALLGAAVYGLKQISAARGTGRDGSETGGD